MIYIAAPVGSPEVGQRPNSLGVFRFWTSNSTEWNKDACCHSSSLVVMWYRWMLIMQFIPFKIKNMEATNILGQWYKKFAPILSGLCSNSCSALFYLVTFEAHSSLMHKSAPLCYRMQLRHATDVFVFIYIFLIPNCNEPSNGSQWKINKQNIIRGLANLLLCQLRFVDLESCLTLYQSLWNMCRMYKYYLYLYGNHLNHERGRRMKAAELILLTSSPNVGFRSGSGYTKKGGSQE